MKYTTGDKFAFACVLAVTLLTAGGWVFAVAAERHAEHVMQTVYGQSTPEFGAAVAASNTANADDDCLARGR